MRIKLKFEIEELFKSANCEIVRFKVIGGWIVLTTVQDKNKLSCTQTFVSDSEYGWMITKPLVEEEKCPILE